MNHSPTVASSRISFLPITGDWWLPYLAVPYRRDGRDLHGWDCYGCVRHILSAHADIELLLFDGRSAAEIVRQARRWQRQDIPQKFDVVTMSVPARRRFPLHVGVVVSSARVLHCDEGVGTVCVPLTHVTIAHRIQAFYRYAENPRHL